MRFFNGAERGCFRHLVAVGWLLPVVVGAMCLSVGTARGAEHEENVRGGGTRKGEFAVASALNWLYRHQDKQYDGWSFDKYQDECVDNTCTGAGVAKSDAGATGMALLCFLGAGQTHTAKGPYRRTIELGLISLVRHQERDGNLAKDCTSPMYSHGIATLALCEAYGMTGDHMIGDAAQKAIDCILAAQKEKDNEWRYFPDDPGGLADRSAATWQVLALRSAQVAKLKVDARGLARAGKWLDPVEEAPSDPKANAPTMIAGGLLSREFLKVAATDPKVIEGVNHLMSDLPDVKNRNTYYWFYGTLALLLQDGRKWDTWNRAVRKALIASQVREEGCAKGSWDPDQPVKDAWGKQGGRLMLTALSCLTLEVYYRYLPLFQLDAGNNGAKTAASYVPRGMGGRGSGRRQDMVEKFGGTEKSESAVALALNWLWRHQDKFDGGWSFDKYKKQCTDAHCTGAGSATADAGATGMALLCFLGAGQTHKTKGPYRRNIEQGLIWLVRHQERNGNLSKGCISPMYSHGIATAALCEAYGLSGDRTVGKAAQSAVNYIIAAQNKQDNGWRYNPGDPGDTSATGWQIMALHSAQLAGLKVGGPGAAPLESAGKWLDLVKTGPNDSQFQYQPGTGPTPTMTAVGLLGRQYLDAKRDDPLMTDGVQYLMHNLPDMNVHNMYYWYYGTQVLHNYGGKEWDTWNPAMRDLLIDSQTRDKSSCANGSWDPDNPSKDQWGVQGGRLMLTALSCLTLEVYYRYMPVYPLDAKNSGDKATGEKTPPNEPEPTNPAPVEKPAPGDNPFG